MAEKLERFRQMAQRIKDKVLLPQLNANSREKVEQIVAKITPGTRVVEMAEKFKQENFTRKVKDLVSKYEKFTGVEEIMALQNTVIDAQDRFMRSQDRRRDLGRKLASIESRLKELHAEMQNTMKGDEKYLHLCTEEHKLIIQERALRGVFVEAEREERELFAAMSAAVKLGHERERAHAERNKYWYIVASILGTVLGIAGSTINNRLKMAEFRDMMEQQMARSAGVLYSIAGGGTAHKADITEAMKTEFKYQAQLAENLKIMQDYVIQLVNKQNSMIDHMNHQEHAMETQIKELKRVVIAASKSSAKSDAELAKVLSSVQHDFQEQEDSREKIAPMPPVFIEEEPEKKATSLDTNQVLTAVGLVFCAAIIFGNIIGRVS